MDKADRKAVLAAYKERKTAAGIFAIRCLPTGQCWVGQAPDLTKIQNRIWFSLRQGNHRHASLQTAWVTQDAGSFAFEEIERIDEETVTYVRDRLLKERLLHWRAALQAEAL